jgi:precorrin-8X/cobalt-precorrin-8 methylmutase
VAGLSPYAARPFETPDGADGYEWFEVSPGGEGAGTPAPRRAGTPAAGGVHPIELRSWEIMRSRVDTSHLPPWSKAVAERVIHCTADPGYLEDLCLQEEPLARAARALADGLPVVTDTRMAAAGITTLAPLTPIADPAAARLADELGCTRSAAAMVLAARRLGSAAVWVVGNAPTALEAVVDLATGTGIAAAADLPPVDPLLVVGLPVGFVGAAQSKARLRASGLPSVSNVSEKGGSNIAAAAVNALLYGDPLAQL